MPPRSPELPSVSRPAAPGSVSRLTHATTAFSETRGSLPGAAPAAAARVGGDRGGDRCRRPQSAVHGSLIGNNNRTPGRHTVVRRPQAPILPRRCHSAATSSTAHRAESVLAADMLSRWLLAAFARAGRPARLTRHAIVPRRYAVLPLESTSLTPFAPLASSSASSPVSRTHHATSSRHTRSQPAPTCSRPLHMAPPLRSDVLGHAFDEARVALIAVPKVWSSVRRLTRSKRVLR